MRVLQASSASDVISASKDQHEPWNVLCHLGQMNALSRSAYRANIGPTQAACTLWLLSAKPGPALLPLLQQSLTSQAPTIRTGVSSDPGRHQLSSVPTSSRSATSKAAQGSALACAGTAARKNWRSRWRPTKDARHCPTQLTLSEEPWDDLVGHQAHILLPVLAVLGSTPRIIAERSVGEQQQEEDEVEVGQQVAQPIGQSPAQCCSQLRQVVEVPCQAPPACSSEEWRLRLVCGTGARCSEQAGLCGSLCRPVLYQSEALCQGKACDSQQSLPAACILCAVARQGRT